MRTNSSLNPEALQLLIERVAEIIAKQIVECLKPELHQLFSEERWASTSVLRRKPTDDKTHGSLWSVDEIAKDSDTSPSTWRRWILERKIPVVRLGRSVRIKDSDYRKLIENSFTPELKWDKGTGRFS